MRDVSSSTKGSFLYHLETQNKTKKKRQIFFFSIPKGSFGYNKGKSAALCLELAQKKNFEVCAVENTLELLLFSLRTILITSDSFKSLKCKKKNKKHNNNNKQTNKKTGQFGKFVSLLPPPGHPPNYHISFCERRIKFFMTRKSHFAGNFSCVFCHFLSLFFQMIPEVGTVTLNPRSRAARELPVGPGTTRTCTYGTPLPRPRATRSRSPSPPVPTTRRSRWGAAPVPALRPAYRAPRPPSSNTPSTS